MEETQNKQENTPEGESAPEPGNGDGLSKPALMSEASPPEPTGAPQGQRRFPGELSLPFEDVLGQIERRNRLGLSLLVFLSQPLLGALSHRLKTELEARIGNKMVFSAAVATGLNMLLNFIAYPLVLMFFAVMSKGVEVLFSQDVNNFILLGLFFALVEGVFRLREGIFHARPEEDLVLRGAFYGALIGVPVKVLLSRRSGLLRSLPVPVEGFYGKGFVEKIERERRYGQAYTIEDLGGAYHLRMQFPRKTPEIGLSSVADLPGEMPDYDYELDLRDGHFVVKGRCVDERVKKITGNVGAFPPGFTTVIPLHGRVKGFSHRYENKILDVLLLKEKNSRGASS